MPCGCTSLLYGTSTRLLVDTNKASDLGALGGTRTPSLLIRSKIKAVQCRPTSSLQPWSNRSDRHAIPPVSGLIQVRC
jgi:hypothetical protein